MDCQELERFLYENIPLSKAIGIEVQESDAEHVVLSAPLIPNINQPFHRVWWQRISCSHPGGLGTALHTSEAGRTAQPAGHSEEYHGIPEANCRYLHRVVFSKRSLCLAEVPGDVHTQAARKNIDDGDASVQRREGRRDERRLRGLGRSG